MERSQEFSPPDNLLPDYFENKGLGEIKHGYSTQVIWGRISLVNHSKKTIKKKLFFDSPLSGVVTFYLKGKTYITGSSIPLSKRHDKSIYPTLDFTLKPGETQTIYFKRDGHHVFNTIVYISNEVNFFFYKLEKENQYRYYIGAILALILYNLMLVIFFKNKKYLIYCWFALSFLLAVLNLHGFLDYYDIFSNTTFSHYLILTSSMALISAMGFGFTFLDYKTYLKDFSKYLKIIIYLTFIPIVLAFTPIYVNYITYFGYMIDGLIMIGLFLLIIACIVSHGRGSPMAKIYIISWSFVFAGAMLYYGNTFGVLPKIFITEYGFLLGNVAEMVILSLGLGYQVAIIDKQNREALIKAEGKERYQQLLRVISHDILNSLQVIVMASKRLKKTISDERVDKIAEKIDRSTSNVLEILDQVKTEEKLTEDRKHIKLESVDLTSVVNDNILIFEDKLLDKNILVSVDISNEARFVLAERLTLKNNVLGNILSNSIKFSPENSEIKIKSREEDGKIKLTIRDFGSGFSSEAMDYLNKDLKMTFSTPGTKGELGTGFGLRIIKSYIGIYNGSISVFNDNGATFEISFQKWD